MPLPSAKAAHHRSFRTSSPSAAKSASSLSLDDQKFMTRTLRKNRLKFTELFSYPPSVFLQANHPWPNTRHFRLTSSGPILIFNILRKKIRTSLPKRSSSPTSSPTGNQHDRPFDFIQCHRRHRRLYHRYGHLIPGRAKVAHRLDSHEKSLDIMRVGWIKLQKRPCP